MTETYEYRFALPDAHLSPNGSRGNRHAEHRARREYRQECVSDLLIAKKPPVPLPFSYVYVTALMCRSTSKQRPIRSMGRYRPTDEPNLISALKPMFDALQDAGVIEQDNSTHMRMMAPHIDNVPTFAEEGIVVRVVPAPEGFEGIS